MYGSIFDKVSFNNGYEMPRHGTGPSRLRPGVTMAEVLACCVENGYRSFDSGARYGTEGDIGAFIRECGIARGELFVTTKVNNMMQGYDNTMRDFERSIRTLGLDYVDLYLIHCPVPFKGEYVNTWRALTDIYDSGRVKAIGVSNFTVQHFYDLADSSDIVPVVNQIEQHPFYVQPNLLAYMKKHQIVSQSYSPLGQGRFANEKRLDYLAKKHRKTPAQIILRWNLQSGFMFVTNSSNPERIRQNAGIYDFKLDQDDMAYVFSLNHQERIWHIPDRFCGTIAHDNVEKAFGEEAEITIRESGATAAQKENARKAIERLMKQEDVDHTKDIIIYCFAKAAALYGQNVNIESQAIANARKAAREFALDALSNENGGSYE